MTAIRIRTLPAAFNAAGPGSLPSGLGSPADREPPPAGREPPPAGRELPPAGRESPAGRELSAGWERDAAVSTVGDSNNTPRPPTIRAPSSGIRPSIRLMVR